MFMLLFQEEVPHKERVAEYESNGYQHFNLISSIERCQHFHINFSLEY